ncbi:transposase [Myxococcota bacterium]|nr:transposase [Myxococcota bacterium]MCZ7619577.1 transposase [Myxococcota bacterium]
MARPPVATERLLRMEDGRLLYKLKHRWRDGTTHVVFEPQELVEKLAALVPPPRFHLVRYHGVLGPCASERDRVVPGAPQAHMPARPPPGSSSLASLAEPLSDAETRGRPRREPPDRCSPPVPSSPVGAPPTRTPCGPEEPLPEPGEPTLRPRRLAWAELLRRVFAVDVLECPRCGGRMRLLAAIQPPDVTQAILDCLELPSRAPPTVPAVPDAEGWPGDFEASR